jgi:hypothetical protein
MRLTLRNVMAYMDGLLGPEDAEDIAKKIEESKTATEIYHKLRDVMRRVRLSAPSITERGLDPNTMAEYLDHELPADQVPDFEKVCLESDLHLAEVGSCHQILALVLQEPAVIDPESRERMYHLPQVARQATVEPRPDAPPVPSGDGAPASSEPAPHRKRQKPTVPDYLREPSPPRPLFRVAALLVLVGCFVALALLACGQFEPDKPLGSLVRKWFGGHEQAAQSGDGTEEESSAVAAAKTVGQEDSGKPKPQRSEPDGAVKEKPSPSAEGTKRAPPTAEKVDGPALTAPEQKPGPPPGVPAAAPPEKASKSAAIPPGEAPKEPPAKVPAEEPAKLGPAPPVAPGEKQPIAPPAKPLPVPDVALLPTPKPGPGPGPVPKTVVPEPAAGQRIGMFRANGQQVLLKYDAATSSWRRVHNDSPLLAGDQLLALPAFRPWITLNSGATIELVGGTRVHVLPEEPPKPAGIEVPYGQIVLKPSAQAGVRVRLVAGQRSGVLTLSDMESVAALEVMRVHPPGADPGTEAARVAVDLYVPHGEVSWEEEGGAKPVKLEGAARRDGTVTRHAVSADPADLSASAGPKDTRWIAPPALGPVEAAAVALVEKALVADRSAALGLMEAADQYQRKLEVRTLVAKCLGCVGQFESTVAALNDVTRKRDWPDFVEQLRLAVARDRQTAAAVRLAFEKQFGQDALALYRMLWGYTDKGLADGDDMRLVKYLDHEMLAFRVLALWNLKEITGFGLNYFPDWPAVRRQTSLVRWRQKAQQGAIRLKGGSAAPAEPGPDEKEPPDSSPAKPSGEPAKPRAVAPEPATP